MPTFRFLQEPTPDHIRKQIQNIDDSYTHPWDILAELAQNSVDAIREHRHLFGQTQQHSITITLDRPSRSIIFRDTGTGIAPDALPQLLAPHGTDKPQNQRVIGQKGVGLTYAIFKCNRFAVKTQATSGYSEAHVDGGANWKTGASPDVPVLDILVENHHAAQPTATYTEITLRNVEVLEDGADDIFALNAAVLEAILRTRTAVGSTRNIFGLPADNISVKLEVQERDQPLQIIDITPTYLLPELLIEAGRTIDLADYERQAAHLNDQQRTRLLQGKCVRKVGSENRAGRQIRYYAFFAPSRKLWKDINVRNGFRTEHEAEDGDLLYHDGIFVATRGMPTGIELTHPVTRLAGNWPQMFMLFEDDALSFDLGRKSIPGRTQGLLKEIAGSLFTELTDLAQYLSADPPTVAPILRANREIIFAELEDLAPQPYSGIPYQKTPAGQEAAVVAMFHELLGAERLRGYQTLACGYKMTYDWWGYYIASQQTMGRNRRDGLRDTKVKTVIEFKYRAESILNDLENNKWFADIDIIVCWDLDEEQFARSHVQVRPIHADDSFFFGVNYELEWPGTLNLGQAGIKHVIALRRVLEELARERRV